MGKYNSQAFTPEQVDNGELQDLLNYLLAFNNKSKKSYMDIHITSDGYCIIVEWCEINWEFREECGKFEFIDSGEIVMQERYFPDNHCELCYGEDHYQQRLKEWLEEHPGWTKTVWGTWTNEIENEKWRKALEGDSKEETKDEPNV